MTVTQRRKLLCSCLPLEWCVSWTWLWFSWKTRRAPLIRCSIVLTYTQWAPLFPFSHVVLYFGNEFARLSFNIYDPRDVHLPRRRWRRDVTRSLQFVLLLFYFPFHPPAAHTLLPSTSKLFVDGRRDSSGKPGSGPHRLPFRIKYNHSLLHVCSQRWKED